MTSPPKKPTVSVVPATARTRSWFLAPQAWPISTDEPVPKPSTKDSRNSISGKNAEAAANAPTPTILPTKMLLMVPDSACRMLDNIIGPRNNRKVFQTGRWVFKAGTRWRANRDQNTTGGDTV